MWSLDQNLVHLNLKARTLKNVFGLSEPKFGPPGPEGQNTQDVFGLPEPNFGPSGPLTDVLISTHPPLCGVCFVVCPPILKY